MRLQHFYTESRKRTRLELELSHFEAYLRTEVGNETLAGQVKSYLIESSVVDLDAIETLYGHYIDYYKYRDNLKKQSRPSLNDISYPIAQTSVDLLT